MPDVTQTHVRAEAVTTWRHDAACSGMPLEAFYPVIHTSTSFDAARAACASCPVLERCAAEMAGDTWGFWAGSSPAERARSTHAAPRRWSESDDALIASALPDEEVATRTWRTLNAVRLRRSRMRAATDPARIPRRRRPHHRSAA